MARGVSLKGIEKERFEKDKESTAIQQEETIKLDEKRKREHKAVVSDIPKDANADLEKLDPNSLGYRIKIKHRFCSCCNELATKIVSYDYKGIQLIEKYCDTHVKIYGPQESLNPSNKST
jgi:hypothetical protein